MDDTTIYIIEQEVKKLKKRNPFLSDKADAHKAIQYTLACTSMLWLLKLLKKL
jgi:hypothetical protein